jgi:predicted flap endonuclease-1-like 5' DNA nuclease
LNGLTLLLLLAMVAGIAVAWRAGVVHGRRAMVRVAPAAPPPSASPPVDSRPAPPSPDATDAMGDEQARIARSLCAENYALRAAIADEQAMRYHATEFAEDRTRLLRDLAAARAETARYRDLCIGLENDAAPPLLDGPNAPDDLKLIVGVGPVLERMLHQLGISTYRQIARWSERDIDEFDARLPEFPGRIRRDAWVTQARALHQSKFGETLPARER